MNFWDVFGEMLVILFAIAAGYAANRLGYLGGEADQKVSKLLLNITMPAMIVAAVITGEELPELGTILSILEVGVVFYLLEAVFALVVPRFLPGTQGQKGVWRYALAFPNVGFIGYPVAVALFGDGARLPGAGDRCHPDGHARSSERDAAEHGVRRRHRVHGTDHLPDHGGVHRDHSHRRRAAALSLERKPICLTFNNWSPT